MRIIQWNCQGSFRTKNSRVLNLNPDILVICECESPERLKFDELIPAPNSHYWTGDSPHKGIAAFSCSDLRIELMNQCNPEFRYVVPLRLSSPNLSFNLLAVWAMGNKENRLARYIGQVWLAMQYYSRLFEDDWLIVGDFNSNQIWDHKKRLGNHTDVVNTFSENGIHSLYHQKYRVKHGDEKHPTFFLQRKEEKPYHIDSCFASNHFLNRGFDVKIGAFKHWNDVSDHVPLIVDLNEENTSCNKS